ncbi:Sugar kinase of the NBD/HSP70 family, may contain an N-terminal HTH domain [Tangfeifania diversioriginum]|uniref:Sugar kinase of the NBD/HSP70 family, may contain an N-terminal HTH domain n=1 Tax=Tangfeifania diversioriginum TaxID=1168035 RepID=A0A1M6HQZ7_9BACT|nr:ROK family protein [Tangfeifania diversioriginum]SHJ24618.1 Sugar kinase of the NBD/HSP70 family, may contain an N-terminal HTH domain [Tangfeifania diversioriginum]
MEKLFKHTGNQSQGVEQKKVSHKKQILRALYFRGPLSNSELSKVIKLSTPKINSLLIELINDGLVNELGRGDSSGGRRPNIYGLVENGFYVAGITININRTIISIFNSNNKEITESQYFPVKMQADFNIFHQVNEKLGEVAQKYNIDRKKILSVGLELPGLINQKQGVNKTYFPEIKNFSEELNKIFGMPVYFSHDSKLRAFSEQHFGLAKNKKNVIMIQVDWGLGIGIIINGKLYAGKSGYSGEFGHLPIVDNGILCSCGKQGCLETIVSATAITRMAKQGIENGTSSLISDLLKGDLEKIDISTVIQAANRGDQFAISIFSDVGYWLGKGIVYLIQIFNPELIVLGGRVTEARQFITAPIQQAINTFSNRDISDDTEIKFSELGQKAGPMGAAAYAIEKMAALK